MFRNKLDCAYNMNINIKLRSYMKFFFNLTKISHGDTVKVRSKCLSIFISNRMILSAINKKKAPKSN